MDELEVQGKYLINSKLQDVCNLVLDHGSGSQQEVGIVFDSLGRVMNAGTAETEPHAAGVR